MTPRPRPFALSPSKGAANGLHRRRTNATGEGELEIHKAVIRSFDAAAHAAAVQITGSLATWLDAVPVARNIPAAAVTRGRHCAVLFFDPANPADAVVLAVYG